MSNTADKVIAVSLLEVGYLEKKDGNLKYLYDKTANAGYNNYTKYGYEMHKLYPYIMDYPAAWCDCFVDWCMQKAYGVSTAKSLLDGNFDDYTVASAQMYKKRNAWHEASEQALPGDQVFFTNNRKFSGICHTGLVYAADSLKIYTTEGNTSSHAGVVPNGGAVCKKEYLRTSSGIAGYGRPAYDPGVSSMKILQATTLNKRPTWIGEVTASSLNVRTWAGTNNSCLKSVPSLAKGTYVDVCDALNDKKGNPWYYIRIGGKIYGFVSAQYIRKI
jgi:hypothetical protein